MFHYEDLSNIDNKGAVAAAEEAIVDGWSRRGYDRIQFTDVPWQLRTPEERSWNFHIHCWDMLDSQFKAHSLTGDEKYLNSALAVVIDWIRYTETDDEQEKSPMVWYDMAVGLRSYRLAYLIDAGEKQGILDEGTRSRLWNVLEQHRVYLAEDANIKFHNNHGFYQIAGQLAMGRRFRDRYELMAQAYTQGEERLLDM